MKHIISIILGVVFIGIVVVLCLFSCIISSLADNYWEELRNDLEGKNDGH